MYQHLHVSIAIFDQLKKNNTCIKDQSMLALQKKNNMTMYSERMKVESLETICEFDE